MTKSTDGHPMLFDDPEVGMRKVTKQTKISREMVFNDYNGFVEKFKPKKTTDDCYTPAEIYDTIRDWVDINITPLRDRRIVRPFYPGGDYEMFDYQPGDIVLDNPPFSILAKIRRYYQARDICYFLFAPALTLFASPAADNETFIVADANIEYANGARVATSFVTNATDGRYRVMIRGDLGTMVSQKSLELTREGKKSKKKHILPMAVITSATLGRLAKRGICLNIPRSECLFIRRLDAQSASGDALYGGGYLISERAAAERAAAERAAAETWVLSPREQEISRALGPWPCTQIRGRELLKILRGPRK